jgi:hypothetical protein
MKKSFLIAICALLPLAYAYDNNVNGSYNGSTMSGASYYQAGGNVYRVNTLEMKTNNTANLYQNPTERQYKQINSQAVEYRPNQYNQ